MRARELSILLRRFADHALGRDRTLVLNRDAPASAPAGPDVAGHLKALVGAVAAEASDPASGRLDYGRARGNPAYARYRQRAGTLHAFDPGTLAGRDARLAFWINLYNALVIDAVIQLGVRTSVMEVPGFFWRVAYGVGGVAYSLDDIEQGVLRGNADHPILRRPLLGQHDPRRRQVIEPPDARVHFALTCATRSCPPVRVYDAPHIDRQLDLAAWNFINGGGVEVDLDRRIVRLSQIFRWYARDFGSPLEFVARYLADGPEKSLLQESSDLTADYLPYDWRLNV